jgi:hypothetical protein
MPINLDRVDYQLASYYAKPSDSAEAMHEMRPITLR